MTTKDEALKMAISELLDVLKSCDNEQVHFDGDDFHETLEACREALEQPKKKKYLYAHSYGGLIIWSETNINVPDRLTFVGKIEVQND